MKLQQFVFLFNDHAAPRRIPTLLWRDVMRGKFALCGMEGKQVGVVEIDVIERNGKPGDIQQVRAWHLLFNERALPDRTDWQEQPAAGLEIFLTELFSRKSDPQDLRHENDKAQQFWLSDSLDELYEKMPGEPQQWQPDEEQMAQMIAQIWC